MEFIHQIVEDTMEPLVRQWSLLAILLVSIGMPPLLIATVDTGIVWAIHFVVALTLFGATLSGSWFYAKRITAVVVAPSEDLPPDEPVDTGSVGVALAVEGGVKEP